MSGFPSVSVDALCESTSGSLSFQPDGLHWQPYSAQSPSASCGSLCMPSRHPNSSFHIPMQSLIGATQEGNLFKAFYFDRVPFSTCGMKAVRYKLNRTDPGFRCNPAQSLHLADEIRKQCSWWGRESPPSVALVVNPCSGKGKAMEMVHETLLPVLRDAAGWRVDVVTSESPSLNDLGLGGKLSVTEATRLIAAPVSSLSSSESSKDHKVDLVAFVGGDGTVFEGLQGLMDSCLANTSGQAPSASKLPHHHRPLPFVHVPGGSGNGLAASCGLWDVETAAVAIVKGVMGKLDIASVLQPSAASDPSEQGLGGKRFYSFLSTVFGLLSNIDIGTEHLRWMGEARYTHKVIQEAMALRPYPCRVAYLPASHGLNPSLSSESSQGHQVPGFPSGLPLPCLSQHKLLSSASKIDPLALPPNWRVLPRTDFNFLALYNAPFMATHARLNPRGSLSNGTMDLLWAEGLQGFMGRMQFLNMMLQSEEGGHVDLGFFNSEKVKAFAIEPLCEDTWLVVDGEVVERRTTWIEVHSSACDVIILPMDR